MARSCVSTVARTMKRNGMEMASGDECRLKMVLLGVKRKRKEYERHRSISSRRGESGIGCFWREGEGEMGTGSEEEGERKKSSHFVRRGKIGWRE